VEAFVFCPQCGHQQTPDDMRFCARCGLPLGLVTDLVAGGRDQFEREKRELTGVGLMLATVLMLLNFLFVFGVTTLPHVANPVFLWIWLFFVISSFVVGGLGLMNLIRGGFFKRLKLREAQLLLMKTELDRQENARLSDTSRALPPNQPASVIEMTTRELDPVPKTRKREQG
jgi:zinc-ribbon domain